jgi:hypothetical protein
MSALFRKPTLGYKYTSLISSTHSTHLYSSSPIFLCPLGHERGEEEARVSKDEMEFGAFCTLSKNLYWATYMTSLSLLLCILARLLFLNWTSSTWWSMESRDEKRETKREMVHVCSLSKHDTRRRDTPSPSPPSPATPIHLLSIISN